MKSRRGIFSSLTHKLPQRSTHYAETADQLRGLGIYVCHEDSELIDDYRDQLKAIRRDYPELPRRQQQLTAFEGVLMNRLDEVRALLDKPLPRGTPDYDFLRC
jgi:hypothetical protein